MLYPLGAGWMGPPDGLPETSGQVTKIPVYLSDKPCQKVSIQRVRDDRASTPQRQGSLQIRPNPGQNQTTLSGILLASLAS
jgi:hypothetical protein